MLISPLFRFQGRNLSNFSFVFWSKRWHQKDILKLTDLYVSQQQTFFLSLQKENFHFHAYPVLTNVGVKVVVKSQLNFYTFLMITIFMRSLLCKCGIILQKYVNKGFYWGFNTTSKMDLSTLCDYREGRTCNMLFFCNVNLQFRIKRENPSFHLANVKSFLSTMASHFQNCLATLKADGRYLSNCRINQNIY